MAEESSTEVPFEGNRSVSDPFNGMGEVILLMKTETGIPILAIVYAVFSIATIMVNILTFIFYLKCGMKSVHGFFVMSLCVGNTLIGSSVLLGVMRASILNGPMPYLCFVSSWTATWGLMFNITLTSWICFERYLIVQNISRKGVTWMENWKIFIVAFTGTVISLYLAFLLFIVQDEKAIVCNGLHVFRHMYPLYAGMTSVPMFCILVFIVIVYKKTLYKLSKMRQVHDKRTGNVQIKQASLFWITRQSNLDLQGQECLPAGPTFDTVKRMESASSIVRPSSIDLQDLEINEDNNFIEETDYRNKEPSKAVCRKPSFIIDPLKSESNC